MQEARHPARYFWLGDSAIAVELGNVIDPVVHGRVRAFCMALEQQPPAGFREAVPAYRTVTVHFHPLAADPRLLVDELRGLEAQSTLLDPPPGRLHVIPVHYGGEDGPDLQAIASAHGITDEEVIRLHSEREYLVYALGFTPGFPFLGGLPAELETERLASPRKLVPAGSVAIGGQQTGVYPVASPGGWRLIGRTNVAFFDPEWNPPSLLRPGDRVLFRAVASLPTRLPGRASATSDERTVPNQYLEVLQPGLFSTVQDAGRHGYQAYGVPVSGAIDHVSCRLANALVGNALEAATLEMTLTGATLRASGPLLVAVTGAEIPVSVNDQQAGAGRTIELAAGDILRIGRAERGARAYLGVAGGFEVPVVLGSRSTYTRAQLGGFQGRQLQAGDRLPVGRMSGKAQRITAEPDLPARMGAVVIRVVRGPQEDHLTAESMERFLKDTFTISNDADRMGFRLSGPRLHHRGPPEIISDGVALGSIQVPPHGSPVVMMADRQSMGGYPKIANVISRDVPLLAQCPPGTKLRFKAVEVEEAWNLLREREGRILADIAGAGEPAVGRALPVEELNSLIEQMQRRGIEQMEYERAGVRVRIRRARQMGE